MNIDNFLITKVVGIARKCCRSLLCKFAGQSSFSWSQTNSLWLNSLKRLCPNVDIVYQMLLALRVNISLYLFLYFSTSISLIFGAYYILQFHVCSILFCNPCNLGILGKNWFLAYHFLHFRQISRKVSLESWVVSDFCVLCVIRCLTELEMLSLSIVTIVFIFLDNFGGWWPTTTCQIYEYHNFFNNSKWHQQQQQ